MLAHDLSDERLLAALHAGTCLTTERAAIDLLAWHGTWLRRSEVSDHITIETDPAITGHAGPVARIEWPSVDRDGPASTSERAILDIARGLAAGEPLDLGSAVVGLDYFNSAAVAMAVLRAAGPPQAAVRVAIPPRFPPGVRVLRADGAVLQDVDDEPATTWHELNDGRPEVEVSGR